MYGQSRITRSGKKRALLNKNKDEPVQVSDSESNVYKKPLNYISTLSPVNIIGSPDNSDTEYNDFSKRSDDNEGSDVEIIGEEFTYSKIYSPRASPTDIPSVPIGEVKDTAPTKPEWLKPSCFEGKTWKETVDMLTEIINDFDIESSNVHFIAGLITCIKSQNYYPDINELRCKITKYFTELTN